MTPIFDALVAERGNPSDRCAVDECPCGPVHGTGFCLQHIPTPVKEATP